MKHLYILALFLLIAGSNSNLFAQSNAVSESMSSGNYQHAIHLILSENQSLDKMEKRHLENLGYCYIMTKDYDKAQQVYLELLSRRNPKTEYYLYYAELLFISGEYKQAKDNFQKYLDDNPNENLISIKIASCDSLKIWDNFKSDYLISNKNKINTIYDETSPNIFEDNILYLSNFVDTADFASNRLSMKIYRFNGNESEQVIETISDNYWPTSLVYNESREVFAYSVRPIKKSMHDFNLGNAIILFFEPDGYKSTKTVEFTWNGKPDDINVTHPAFAKNGKRLYFASDMPGGYGGMDLYYSDFDGNNWSEPVNLGKKINTPFNEVSPFISGDTVLYFSSNGHPGYGNLDVFASYINKDNLSAPVNMKSPVNSIGEDMFFRPTSKYQAFLSSNRSAMSKGGFDIFKLSIPVPEEPEIIEDPEEDIREPHRFDPQSFDFSFVLFDINSSEIAKEYTNIINNLADTLKEYGYMKIEIIGYADHSGPESFNNKLSEERAVKIAQKLVQMGVNKNQISSSGKGVSQIKKLDNIKYHVVIGTIPNDNQQNWYKNILNGNHEVGVLKVGDLYSYYIGDFDNYSDAAKLRDSVRKNDNFKTAYIGHSYFGKFFRNYNSSINRRVEFRFIDTENK